MPWSALFPSQCNQNSDTCNNANNAPRRPVLSSARSPSVHQLQQRYMASLAAGAASHHGHRVPDPRQSPIKLITQL
ncbi:hypothetical protein BS78_10G115200 [Paspalum vaginatum]|nr:hypothetical protein BS78_10G115200 [Paspalum vaginatum]